MTKPTVIIHTDATGWVDFLMHGEVNVYIVDERYPGDRVYQWTEKCTDDEIKAVLGDSQIGSKNDERHAALSARIIEALDGTPRLRVVQENDGVE